MGKTIEFYKTLNGKCPVEKFLDSLDGKTAQKVVWVLKLIEELDIVPKTYFKKLSGTEAIWECRIQLGSNIYRIFCFFAKQNRIVLTHGIVKKTQKTPKNEIKKAEKYRKEYLKL
ncbi:type II toxin-antitoxin system RelE/ParE family toxin [bacterium]|nr:type II toxin-antitoxin system RelE/ParE family toxin [bacterium]